MRNEQKVWPCIASTLAVALALTGCSEPSSPAAPSANSPLAPLADHSGVVTSVVNAYTPEKEVISLASCNLERVDGVAFSAESIKRSPDQVHSFSGWIAAPRVDKPAYWLRFDDKQANRFFQAHLGQSVDRADVVAAVRSVAIPLRSGFKVDIAANALAAGQYHVYLVAIVGDTAYSCDNGRQVSIGD